MSEVILGPSTASTYAVRAAHGAASELRACAALMDAGYYVFRAESQSSPFDLVAYRDGRMLRVEVKSVTIRDDGRSAPVFSWPIGTEWDLLVVVGSAQVWCFDASTSREDAVDVVRVAYGFEALAGRVHPANKLDLAKAAEIRRRAAAGEGLHDLARAYGVTWTCISAVVKGRTWARATEAAG